MECITAKSESVKITNFWLPQVTKKLVILTKNWLFYITIHFLRCGMKRAFQNYQKDELLLVLHLSQSILKSASYAIKRSDLSTSPVVKLAGVVLFRLPNKHRVMTLEQLGSCSFAPAQSPVGYSYIT